MEGGKRIADVSKMMTWLERERGGDKETEAYNVSLAVFLDKRYV